MRCPNRPRSRSAFCLLDAAVLSAAAGVMVCLATVGLSRSRQVSEHLHCSAKLASLGRSNGAFSMSHKDMMVGLTWVPTAASSQFPDLNALQNDSNFAAHSAQAIDIMRRRGRPDIPPSAWFADLNYWSLPLLDFEDRPVSDPFNLCASHDNLNKWRRWPAAFDSGRFMPDQPTPAPATRRWPYASSYRLTGAAMDVNQSVFTSVAPGRRIAITGNHNTFSIPAAAALGPSPMTRVSFPSAKAHLFDSHQRHQDDGHLYFAYEDAVQPILFFDGSVAVHRSGDAITPWHPNQPGLANPQSYLYAPAAWEPPTLNGLPTETVRDRYLFTRDGLLGRDF